MLGASTNDAIPFQPIPNKNGIDLLCPAFYVPEMLRRFDLFSDMQIELTRFHLAAAGYSNTISADDRIIHDLEIVTNTDGVRLAGMDLQIKKTIIRGFAGGFGAALLFAGVAWIVSSAITPSTSYPAVPIVLGSLMAAAGGGLCVVILLPEAKKALK